MRLGAMAHVQQRIKGAKLACCGETTFGTVPSSTCCLCVQAIWAICDNNSQQWRRIWQCTTDRHAMRRQLVARPLPPCKTLTSRPSPVASFQPQLMPCHYHAEHSNCANREAGWRTSCMHAGLGQQGAARRSTAAAQILWRAACYRAGVPNSAALPCVLYHHEQLRGVEGRS